MLIWLWFWLWWLAAVAARRSNDTVCGAPLLFLGPSTLRQVLSQWLSDCGYMPPLSFDQAKEAFRACEPQPEALIDTYRFDGPSWGVNERSCNWTHPDDSRAQINFEWKRFAFSNTDYELFTRTLAHRKFAGIVAGIGIHDCAWHPQYGELAAAGAVYFARFVRAHYEGPIVILAPHRLGASKSSHASLELVHSCCDRIADALLALRQRQLAVIDRRPLVRADLLDDGVHATAPAVARVLRAARAALRRLNAPAAAAKVKLGGALSAALYAPPDDDEGVEIAAEIAAEPGVLRAAGDALDDAQNAQKARQDARAQPGAHSAAALVARFAPLLAIAAGVVLAREHFGGGRERIVFRPDD